MMPIDPKEARDWITLLAAVVAAVAPFAILWIQRRARLKAAQLDWELTVKEGALVTGEEAVLTLLTYRKPERPIRLICVEAINPKDMKLATVRHIHDNYGNVSGYQPDSEWRQKLDLDADVYRDVRFYGGSMREQEFATREILASIPHASPFRRRARLSMRVTIEERSSSRPRARVIVTSQEITLKASNTAKET